MSYHHRRVSSIRQAVPLERNSYAHVLRIASCNPVPSEQTIPERHISDVTIINQIHLQPVAQGISHYLHAVILTEQLSRNCPTKNLNSRLVPEQVHLVAGVDVQTVNSVGVLQGSVDVGVGFLKS